MGRVADTDFRDGDIVQVFYGTSTEPEWRDGILVHHMSERADDAPETKECIRLWLARKPSLRGRWRVSMVGEEPDSFVPIARIRKMTKKDVGYVRGRVDLRCKRDEEPSLNLDSDEPGEAKRQCRRHPTALTIAAAEAPPAVHIEITPGSSHSDMISSVNTIRAQTRTPRGFGRAMHRPFSKFAVRALCVNRHRPRNSSPSRRCHTSGRSFRV